MNKNVYIVIPAKNEASRIGQVIKKTKHQGFHNIIVVNDGSTDNTVAIARKEGATVLTHVINLGAGAATQTGIEFALEKGADAIVTMDADSQHFPSDIKKLVQTLYKNNLDVVIGSRFLNKKNKIPLIRRLYNKVGNYITGLLFGLFVSDSQSGMKAFRASFAKKSKFRFNGYEFCTEFIRLMRLHKASYQEIPIKVIYTKETMAKGQSFKSGFKMAVNLLRYLF